MSLTLPLPVGATREGADAAKASALVFDGGDAVLFAPNTGPANGLLAARELLGERASFSHLKNGYPVYAR